MLCRSSNNRTGRALLARSGVAGVCLFAVVICTLCLSMGALASPQAPGSARAAGSAMELVTGAAPSRPAGPDVYASWNRIRWERPASQRRVDTPQSGPPAGAAPEVGAETTGTSSLAYLAGVVGIGLVIAVAYFVLSRRGPVGAAKAPRYPGGRADMPGTAGGGSEEHRSTVVSARPLVGWRDDAVGVPGAGEPPAPVPRLDGPAPSPEEMKRHLGELLGKVQGAKPLAKRNSDEF